MGTNLTECQYCGNLTEKSIICGKLSCVYCGSSVEQLQDMKFENERRLGRSQASSAIIEMTLAAWDESKECFEDYIKKSETRLLNRFLSLFNIRKNIDCTAIGIMT